MSIPLYVNAVLPSEEELKTFSEVWDSYIETNKVFQNQMKEAQKVLNRIGKEENKMADDLPEGWSEVLFGDVVNLSKTKAKDPIDDGIERFIGLEHIEAYDLKYELGKYC